MADFDSGGVRIAYDDIGPRDGRIVLLIHGFATNRNENWRRLGWYGAIERRGWRIVALDCRGHGESGKPHDIEAYSAASLTGDVLALMDHLGIEHADLMGYSMGARIALAAALTRPERLRHLVIGGIGGKLFDPAPPGHPMALAMEADNAEAISEPMLRSFRMFAQEQGGDLEALAACSRGLDFRFTREMLAQIDVPTLVVAGARDGLAGDPEELAAIIPGARALALPGCDHFSAIPHGLFKAAVFDFLEGVLE
jgi:pimeloyl-ACP methyl ester carboxylesterase